MQKQRRPRKPNSDWYNAIMRTFAERLKARREAAGYPSAQQLARVLKITPHAYRKYERGQSEPNFETLMRMCRALNCTPNDLLPQAERMRRSNERRLQVA